VINDIPTLRAGIERCRRLAESIGDSKTRDNLLALALEYERDLRELEGDPPAALGKDPAG
jgi:hypothetical protein